MDDPAVLWLLLFVLFICMCVLCRQLWRVVKESGIFSTPPADDVDVEKGLQTPTDSISVVISGNHVAVETSGSDGAENVPSRIVSHRRYRKLYKRRIPLLPFQPVLSTIVEEISRISRISYCRVEAEMME